VSSIRVAVAEDSLLVREGIVRILDDAEGIEVVGAAGNADGLLALVDRERPDAVVTDIRMPPTGTDEGIRLAQELAASHPDVAVVVLSQHAEPSYAVALFENGSTRRAYLLKERLSEPGELVRALETVTAGGSLVDARVVHDLLAAQVQRERPSLEALTPRGREILALIAEGASNGAIAEQLVITKRAVERHINAIFQKLELEDSAGISRRVKAALLYLAATDD
jgi:DNA-binding NarL/FixJ family response regulator